MECVWSTVPRQGRGKVIAITEDYLMQGFKVFLRSLFFNFL